VVYLDVTNCVAYAGFGVFLLYGGGFRLWIIGAAACYNTPP
jgi:hypothetical protein